MQRNLTKISNIFYPAAPWFGLVMVFGLPWSHAFFFIGLVGMLACSLAATSHYKEFLSNCREHTGFLAILLFFYIAIGIIYTEATIDLAIFDVKKYRKLLLIPLFLLLYHDIKWANRLLISYGFGVFFLMIPTLLDGTGLLDFLSINLSKYRDGSYSDLSLVYWRNHIVHGFHASMLFVLATLLAIKYKKKQIYFSLIASICLLDIVFFIHGRIALISTAFIALLLSYSYIKNNRLRILILIIMVFGGIFSYEFSKKIQTRVNSISTEARAYFKNHDVNSSGGNRLHYWNMSWIMFTEAPILGNGPGSFRKTLENPENPLHAQPHRHTHNEYLTLLSQHGILGLIIFLLLVRKISINAGRTQDNLLIGFIRFGLVIFLINAMTDSSLHNESEGWTFVLLACLSNMRAINSRAS